MSDLTRHKQLAGSGELVDVRKVTSGPIGLGSVFEANESIQLGDRHLEFLARSIVVTFNPPNTVLVDSHAASPDSTHPVVVSSVAC